MKFIFNDPQVTNTFPTMILKTNQDFYNEPFNKMAGPTSQVISDRRL